MASYVELHAHSHFSLLDGASSPEALVQRAFALGMDSLALTDHDGVYGAVLFAQAARQCGIRPIFGAEISLDGGHHLTLLVENEQGWRNLCTLISLGRHNGPKGQPKLPLQALTGHTEGLIALSGCREGEIPAALLRKDSRKALAAARRYRDLFGPDRFWLELHEHHLGDDALLNYKLVALARSVGVGFVAANDVHYAEPSGHELQDVLVCIRNGVTLEESEFLRRPNSEYYLKSDTQMRALFERYPEAIENTRVIAQRCQFDLRYGLQDLPQFPTEGLASQAYLRSVCETALPKRYSEPYPRDRLDYELGVVERSGLSNYFLVVWDIVRHARENGIRCQGRGSAANSLIAYLLDLSPIDPIAHNLVFERFLSDERRVAPDIDLDIQADRREELIQYVYSRYGSDFAAMACTFVTFRARSALREIGKALGFPPDVLGQAAKVLDTRDAKAIVRSDSLREYLGSHAASLPWQQLMRLCGQIAGFPHHLGIHNGGMILFGTPLASRVPSEPATMQGRRVIQWDKESLEEAGLIKIDLLGLRMLSAVAEALRLIEETTGQHIDLDALRFDDPAVYDMICRAETVGVFQVESRAQAQVLPRLQPRKFEDLIVSISLIRPGPIVGKMVHPFLRRRLGQEPVTYLHPILKPALEESLGILLFQEQVIKVAKALAGFTPGQGERLRRALGSKDGAEAVARFEAAFLSGAEKQGVARPAAQAVFEKLRAFGSYSFPKSHAAAFAVLVYQSAWLKLYYPAHFLAGILSHEPMGFWSPAILVNDAKRRGISVLPVDVQRSRVKCHVENGRVRLGLAYVAGLGEADGKIIQEARQDKPFVGLRDFCRRTRLHRDLVENLILAGAMDSWRIPRRRLLWELGTLSYRANTLDLVFDTEDVPLTPLDETEKAQLEYSILGVNLGDHPMKQYQERLAARGILDSTALEGCQPGSQVQVAGLLVMHQAPPTAKGFHFLTLDSMAGFVNVIVKPDLYPAVRRVLRESPFLLTSGKVQRQQGVTNVLAQRIGPLSI